MSTRAPALILLAALAASCGGGSSSPTGPGGTPTPAPAGIRRERLRLLRRERQRHRRPGRDRAPARRRVSRSAGSPRPPSPAAASRSRASRTARRRRRPARRPCPPTSPRAPRSASPCPRAATWRSPRSCRSAAAARANVYLAFGDSITFGDGSSDGSGYRDELRADLRAYWGKADVSNDGVPGTKSNKGETRVGAQPRHASTGLPADPLRDERLERRGVPRRVPVLHDRRRCARWSSRPATRAPSPIVGTIPPVNPIYADRDADGEERLGQAHERPRARDGEAGAGADRRDPRRLPEAAQPAAALRRLPAPERRRLPA